ncbi:glycosyltransferase family 41 protein [Daedalea quercina L-15889]|uniref:protein O-GlcNAc transferase n=1 Tax=Daedalea quercina L-15889 TaxID=1314783 RepID=A0A165M1N4_9APHY|nr:glycosyltransferase family 41 protein [Daedalea quercina L-15889]
MRDLLAASCVAGYVISASSNGPVPDELMQSLSIPGQPTFQELLHQPPLDLFRVVHASGEGVLDALLRLGGGVLPVLLLLPDQIMRLPLVLFPFSLGVVPAICTRNPQTGQLDLPPESTRQKTNLMTSTILLTLAKRLQDESLANARLPGLGGAVNVSVSLVILLYYVALSISPSPSTYNNLGILLCALSNSRTIWNTQGQRNLLNGPTLARFYYQAGLQLDPNHPHLLTNMGSLLKDQGRVEEAIELYTKAIRRKPDFDIALANLGNAVKDLGRSWDAIEYYRRAVSVNPELPEALCGLVNSLSAICDWRGRGSVPNEVGVDEHGGLLMPSEMGSPGWITKMIEICERQIDAGYAQSVGAVQKTATAEEWLQLVEAAQGRTLREHEAARWRECLGRYYSGATRGGVNKVGFVIRFVDWVQPRLQRQWYIQAFGRIAYADEPMVDTDPDLAARFPRPVLPPNMASPPVPSVLPFHTFTYPLSPRAARLVAHRNALRISFMAHSQTWIPRHVFRPPSPPVHGKLNIGYVSNDVNDHPLAHLMQSVFALHDRERFSVYLYTTSPWDGTDYRPRIASRVEHFRDVSTWSAHDIVDDILRHNIHVRWCDYLICCLISCPVEMSAAELWRKNRAAAEEEMHVIFDFDADADPESLSNAWMYTEKFINIPHSFMVTDHKQSFREDEGLSVQERALVPPEELWRNEEKRRADMRRQIFPDLPQDVVIFANFSQVRILSIHAIFAVWLNILTRVPRSMLWLLRFPVAGEEHLLRTARAWAGEEVASRIRFTNVARKAEHVYRGRVADLFLDTAECNAHTIAADVLWSGTPILTIPKHPHKMCSRVAASMASATGFGDQMVVDTLEEYERRAVRFAESVVYVNEQDPSGVTIPRGHGELIKLRRNIFLNRDRAPLFDTLRWTRNVEKGYREAWRRWVEGTQYEMSDEWEMHEGDAKESSIIWIPDEPPPEIIVYD